MNLARRNKLINIFLILTILSHVTYFHDLLDNYVLCYGTDGHIAIENINDCSDCINTSQKNNNSQSELKITSNYQDNNCNDISLHSNCFGDNQFLLDKKISRSINVDCFIQYLPRLYQKEVFSHSIKSIELVNQALQNYSTVTLLI